MALAFYSSVTAQAALGPDNVLVLYNTASPDGIELANYYAQVHPGVHLLGLNGVTTAEQITGDYYLNVIRPQILPALNSSTNVIVTTKGLPLRISVDQPNPGVYVDPFGVSRMVSPDWWKPFSSLESELTRIDVISTWQQMGDQTYFSQTAPPNSPQQSLNPYYPNYPYYNAKPSAPFDYNNYYISGYGGLRLSARLDGFTTADVKAAIDRAQQAFLIPNSGWVVLDDDPNSVGSDRMLPLKNYVLIPHSQAYVYENSDLATTTAPGPVIGYVSHGTNDGPGGLNQGYIQNQLNFQLANGAVFETHESFNAYSFQPGGNLGGQGLVAEWLAIGGTAGVGNVQEPLSGSSYEANEDQMFKMLLHGYTWAESAWGSMQQLSYVNTVVGDPLMTFKKVIPGDANMDGIVNSADVLPLFTYWNSVGQWGGSLWSSGDFNADGMVNSTDFTIFLANWGSVAPWADSGGTVSAGPLYLEPLSTDAAIPEPPAISLALAGLLALLLRFGWRQLWHARLSPVIREP